MKKNKKFLTKLAAVLLSLILVCGLSVHATLAYLQSVAEPVTNTFVPVKILSGLLSDYDLDVTGTKVLEGRDWQESDNFVFILEKKSGDDWEIIPGGSAYVSLVDGEVTDIEYSDIIIANLTDGTNEFRIREIDTGIIGVKYDESVAEFKVEAEYDGIGGFSLQSVEGVNNTTVTEGEWPGYYDVAFEFVNRYDEPGTVNVTLGVKKTVINKNPDKPISPRGFTFALDGGNLSDEMTASSDKNGDAEFKLTYTMDDVGKSYKYKLVETKGDFLRFGVTYDETVHDVEISIVLGDNEELVPVVSIDGKVVADANRTVEFVNEYDYGEGNLVDPTYPTGPIDPSNPPGPPEPTEPSDPSEPSGPSDPSDPSDPIEPTDPSGPSEPSDPSDPSDPSNASSSSSAGDDASKTGDDANLILPIALLLTTGTIIAVLLTERRRRNHA